MAIYHLSTNTISRGKGKSVIGACAYRTGTKMYCERTGTHHDYSRKQGVMYAGDFVIDDRGLIQQVGATDDRHRLWNNAEAAETRKDGRTGREIIINLPHELPESQRQALAIEFTQTIIRKYKVAATVAIHAPDKDGDQRNHHAHILMTTRQVTLDIDKNFVFGEKTDLELSNTKLKKLGKKITQDQIKDIRHSWAIHCNRALENNGIDARIDHRSHADRGLEQLPTVKMGHFATEMERKGITTDRGDRNRAIKEYNVSLDEIAAIKAEPPPALPAPAPAPPAPKPKPAPAPAKPAQPIVHHAPPPPPPPQPPKPVVISLPLTASYIPGGYNRPLFQQPTVAVGHYKGYKEFESGFVRMGQVDIDLSTMKILNETISKHYPEEYRDDFSRLVRNNAYAFLGRDDKGNEKMGFDKYNEHLKQYHRTSFQCDQSFHGDINKAFEYLQRTTPQVQQVRQADQPHRQNGYDYDR